MSSETLRQPSTRQHALADTLLSLCGECLKKNAEKQRYITLDEQTGKSKNNKNAVGILPEGTSFMVGDWSAESELAGASVPTERHEKKGLGKRLFLPNLLPQVVQQHPHLFTRLLFDAKTEAVSRQQTKRVRQHKTQSSLESSTPGTA